MEFLAKSFPKIETMTEHTDNLLKNLDLLKEIYENINVNWELLKYACIYHDFGKINKKFQTKILGKKVHGEVPHGFLSIAFLDYKELRSLGFSKSEVKILVNAIAYHHERDFDYYDNEKIVDEEVAKLKENAEKFNYHEFNGLDKRINTYIYRFLKHKRINPKIDGTEEFAHYIMIKGLLNRIDYAASEGEAVEWKNDFLIASMDNLEKNVWKNGKFNDLQIYMRDHQDENVIVVAETGFGKTEAGLLWIGDNKGFFTLPLRSAINAIYDRLRKYIVTEKTEERLGLLHGDTFSELLKREGGDFPLDMEGIGVGQYNSRTRLLSLPLTICTIDQLFDFVYKYGGFELKLATLSYSKVVIDEIQMYSPDLIAYLIKGLDDIYKMGGKFSIITATLPPFIVSELKERDINFSMPEKAFINDERIRHSIKVIEDEINYNTIIEKFDNNKVLVIANTVKKVQELRNDILNNSEIDEDEVRIFHSGFTKLDRQEKEQRIIKFGSKENESEKGIWICTQVVEASLDIDFDILITELSDINGLFQRMGRCYRNREFEDNGYNVLVFDGGAKECSGVGFVIDKSIYRYSKEVLREVPNGKIRESKKLELIDEIYTKERLKNTEYYEIFRDTLEYVDGLEPFTFNKTDAKRYFRNINSISVIPKKVYEENYELIQSLIEIMKTRKKDFEGSYDNYREEKARARATINNLTVSIQFYFSNHKNTERIKINDYEDILVYDCEYDKYLGITHIKNTLKEEDKVAADNIF